MNVKANPEDFWGRWREIISDPLNLLIERDANSGLIDKDGNVFLHNSIKVPSSGSKSYYEEFSRVLVVNRGVHEPLEEFCFQETLKKIKDQTHHDRVALTGRIIQCGFKNNFLKQIVLWLKQTAIIWRPVEVILQLIIFQTVILFFLKFPITDLN